MELTANEVWTQILEGAREALPEQAFRTWLAPTEAVAISPDRLVISAPSRFATEWVEDKYGELLAAIGERLFGRRFEIQVQARENGAAPSTPAPAPVPTAAAPATPHAEPAPDGAAPGRPTERAAGADGIPLNDKYTFDRFVVGGNNQLAAAAAHAVAEAPARTYNPLFLYGGVGLGKTHLMHAIGNALLAREPGRRVVYISSERFTNELIGAIQAGTMAEFRRRYRQVDLLLVDDIQFLEGKKQTQEEFFHTFNALHDAQRQIVLTSDRPPKETGLEDRLVSRFEWGLVADIQPPDFETRVAILRKKVDQDGLAIADEEAVLHFIARVRTSSVRELEGAITRLLAYASLTRRELNLELAREALGVAAEEAAAAARAAGPTPESVRAAVAEAWGKSAEALQSKKRTKDLTVPRQVAMFLIKERFDLPLVEIGRLFGGRDHSTVIHSISRVEEEMEQDAEFRARVEELRAGLRG